MKKVLWKLANKIYQKNKKMVKVKVADELKCLHPLEEKQKIVNAYYIQKVSMVFLLFIVVLFLVTIVFIQSLLEVNLKNGNQIPRNSYGEGQKEVTVWAQAEDTTKKHPVDIQIQERQYEKEEVTKLFERGVEELEALALGENESLDQVTKNLCFVNTLQDGMLQVEWELTSYDMVDSDGMLVYKNLSKEGSLVGICAKLAYFETIYEHLFYAKVYLPEKNEEDSWIESLQDELEKSEEKTKYDADITLPNEIGDKEIFWQNKKEKTSLSIFFLGLILIVGIYWGKDQEIHKQYEKRNRQLMLDYSEIVSKLLLLLGAGMTVQGAWKKIAEGYCEKQKTGNQERRYAYDELIVTLHEIQSGISEIEAYDNYGKRCRNQKYVKFMTLLVQSIKKGGDGLRELLEYEVKEAFQERKNVAKKMGEEASTKLLGPMMMMLTIVLIMIVVPACMSFQF